MSSSLSGSPPSKSTTSSASACDIPISSKPARNSASISNSALHLPSRRDPELARRVGPAIRADAGGAASNQPPSGKPQSAAQRAGGAGRVVAVMAALTALRSVGPPSLELCRCAREVRSAEAACCSGESLAPPSYASAAPLLPLGEMRVVPSASSLRSRSPRRSE